MTHRNEFVVLLCVCVYIYCVLWLYFFYASRMSWVPSPHGARFAPLAQRQSVGLMNQKAEDIGQMMVFILSLDTFKLSTKANTWYIVNTLESHFMICVSRTLGTGLFLASSKILLPMGSKIRLWYLVRLFSALNDSTGLKNLDMVHDGILTLDFTCNRNCTYVHLKWLKIYYCFKNILLQLFMMIVVVVVMAVVAN